MNPDMPPETPPETSAEDHLSRAELDAYLVGRLSAADLLELGSRHLEELCEGCRKELPADRERFRRLLAAAEAGLRATLDELETEREMARRLSGALDRLNEAEALLQVTADRRCHTLPFVEQELFRADTALDYGRAERAERALTLAAAGLLRIEPSRYGWHLLREAEAEAWIHKARLGLHRSRPEKAEEALSQAASLGERWDLSPALEADVLFTWGGLRFSRGEEQEAETLFEKAASRIRELRTWRGLFKVVAARAWLDRRRGRPAAAARRLVTLFEGWQFSVTRRDEWWGAAELVRALCDLRGSGEAGPEEAYRYLAKWRLPGPEEDEAGETHALIRRGQVALLAGLVARRLEGNLPKAEAQLIRARNTFLRAFEGLDAALASVELVSVCLDRGDLEHARAVAENLALIGRCEDVDGHTFAHLTGLAQGLFHGKVTGDDLVVLEESLLFARAGWPAGTVRHGTR